jgi:hypothetical protein
MTLDGLGCSWEKYDAGIRGMAGLSWLCVTMQAASECTPGWDNERNPRTKALLLREHVGMVKIWMLIHINL